MNVIRKKILNRTLQLNFKYQKGISGILQKFIEDEEKINMLKSAAETNDVIEVLSGLIETGEFFNYDMESVILDVWETLSHEQQKQIFVTMFNDKNRKQTYSLLSNSYVYTLFESSMGELLYDISFLNTLPGLSGKNGFGYDVINPEYQNLDYSRIISDDILLDYYIKETDVFTYIKARNVVFTEEQAKKMVENGILWVIKHSELKNNINFIENIIMKYPQKVDKLFLNCIPEEIKKNPRTILSSLLSNSKNFDLLVDKETIINNLYILKSMEKTTKMMNPNYECDKKLYILANMNNWNGYDRSGICGKMIWDILTEEEKNIFSLTSSQQNSISSKINNVALLPDSDSIQNKMKFFKIMKINNEVLNLGISNSQIESVLRNNPNIINVLAKQKQLDKVAANNLYYAISNDILDVFLDFCDLGIATKVNMSLITKDLIEKVGYDIIRNVSLYPESFYYLLMLEKNGKLDIYKQMLRLTENLPIDKVRISNILVYACTSYEKIIEQMINNNEFNTENILMLINMTQSFGLVDSNKCNSTKEYYEKTNEFCDKNILSSSDPLMSRELLCQRFFYSGYNKIIEFYDSFVSSQDKIKTQNIKNIFEILGILKECENIDVIKDIYKTLQQSNFKMDKVGMLAITEQLKEEVIGDLVERTLNNENKDNVLDFTGKEVKFLVHVMGAYGATVPADNIYESWNSNKKIDNTGICTSLLNENYFGHARTSEQSVILGFDNISSAEIQLMAPYDLYSNAYGLETHSYRNARYYSAGDLISNTRAHHNEVVINRNLPGGKKRQPSYILCFDTINEDSKKASQQFGIPIVFVDVKKHIGIKLQEIEILKQSFINTQSIDTMKKIINMQETIRCGLLANNSELAQTYFSEQSITSNILFFIENSNDLEVLNQLEILIDNEKNRVVDKSDHRNIMFNGDLNIITEQLAIKKQILKNSSILSKFKEAREEQMRQDKITREYQLAGLTQQIAETKEGYSI